MLLTTTRRCPRCQWNTFSQSPDWLCQHSRWRPSLAEHEFTILLQVTRWNSMRKTVQTIHTVTGTLMVKNSHLKYYMSQIKLYTELVIRINIWKEKKRLDLIFTELMIYFILFPKSPPLPTQQIIHTYKDLKGEKKIEFQYISFYFPTPLPC